MDILETLHKTLQKKVRFGPEEPLFELVGSHN